MNSKAGKLRGKLGSFAKEREEFEQKKRELEEEMHREKQNMGKIRKGLRGNDLNLDTHQNDEDDDNAVKRVRSMRNQKNAQSESSDQLLKAPPIPSGPKISDWCYIGAIDSSPPLVKSQELYEEVRFLGRGAYGTVDLVKNREDNKLYASKTLLLQHKSDEKGFLHEVKFLRQHRHPFIIHLHDVFMSTHPRKVFLIMHYCEGGDLGKVITMAAKNNQPLPEVQILKWISQVGLALSFLHCVNVAHRDIKPVNILLSDNGEVAQLSDFGLATELNHPDHKDADTKAEVGTPYYTSPEMISNERCTLATDCWSLGVCLFEMLALKLPFDGDTTVALVKSILQDQPDLSLIPPNFYSPEIFIPLEGLLLKDPSTRMTINQFLLTPPINGRVAVLPSQYRPKYLEERLRRYHVKQMIYQLEKLGITSTTPQPVQGKSLNTSSEKSITKLNTLGEDDEPDKSSCTTNRSTTRERINNAGKLYEQIDQELGLDIVDYSDEGKIYSNTSCDGDSLSSLNINTNINSYNNNHNNNYNNYNMIEPKDGNKSPMLPSLSLSYFRDKDSSSSSYSKNSVATSSLSTSEASTPLPINMKSVRMISNSSISSSTDNSAEDINKIGPIELASNYLKKHHQNLQYNDIELDNLLLATSSSSSNTSPSTLATSNILEKDLPLKISPRPILATLQTSTILSTSASEGNVSNVTIINNSNNSNNNNNNNSNNNNNNNLNKPRLSIPLVQPLDYSIVPLLKSNPEPNILPDKSYSNVTNLPPLTKHDSVGSDRPTSTDSTMKSARREKKNKEKNKNDLGINNSNGNNNNNNNNGNNNGNITINNNSPIPVLAPVASSEVDVGTDCVNIPSTSIDDELNIESINNNNNNNNTSTTDNYVENK